MDKTGKCHWTDSVIRNFEWTSDELYCAKLVSTEIQVFKTTQFDKGIHSRIKLEGVSSFSISPGKRYTVCVFIPEKKDQPASVRLYDLLSPTVPVSQKTFFRADSAHFHWNQLGTSILVLTQTDMDKTGQSYYGETNLYFLSIAGNFDCKVALDKQGPVHDVHWSPNSKEFMVVYGTMPAKCTLFDHRGSSMYEFPAAARNFVRFNPQGRIICLAGFGNLAGQIEFWDRKTFKKIGSVNGANTSVCEWSPDGRYILTAIVYRRLKVDNGIKIWHYSGALIHKMETKELYQVRYL
jgi:translation initiation factor 2A